MKNYNKYFFLLISIFFALSISCRKIIQVNLNSKDKKIVVNALMTKSRVEARISLSVGLNDQTQDVNYLKFANVGLYEGETLIGNFLNGSDSLPGYYLLPNLNLKYNTDYSLKVENTDYGMVHSVAQIPKPVPIDTILKSSQTISSLDGYSSETYLFAIRIHDKPNLENYYGLIDSSIQSYHDYNYETQKDTLISYKSSLYMSTEDPANEGDMNSLLLFQDDIFDGQSYDLKVNIDKYNFYDTIELNFYLVNISKEYYQYLKTVSKQLDQGNFDLILGATPVQVYNNIEGGFGFFGAYSLSNKKITVEGDPNAYYK